MTLGDRPDDRSRPIEVWSDEELVALSIDQVGAHPRARTPGLCSAPAIEEEMKRRGLTPDREDLIPDAGSLGRERVRRSIAPHSLVSPATDRTIQPVTGPQHPLSAYEERRVGELLRWKRRANGFLLGALVVFLVSHFFGSEAGVNGFIRAASEAALIGGIADWFAVTALFRHPLGIPDPAHRSDPRSKGRDREGLAEFVQQNFLDPANLPQLAYERRYRRPVGEMVGPPEHAALAARPTIETGSTIAKSLDDERVATVITQTSLDWPRQPRSPP